MALFRVELGPDDVTATHDARQVRAILNPRHDIRVIKRVEIIRMQEIETASEVDTGQQAIVRGTLDPVPPHVRQMRRPVQRSGFDARDMAGDPAQPLALPLVTAIGQQMHPDANTHDRLTVTHHLRFQRRHDTRSTQRFDRRIKGTDSGQQEMRRALETRGIVGDHVGDPLALADIGDRPDITRAIVDDAQHGVTA